MDKMDSEDGNYFIKHLAIFIRTHEKALANALQLQTTPKRHSHKLSNGPTSPTSRFPTSPPAMGTSTSTTLASAFSMPSLSFTSQNVKPAKLSLTPHHLFYLLTRFEDLGIQCGPMNVRLESIHAETAPGNYVSFLDSTHRARRSQSSDALSIRSVSSVKSVMSGMSSLWNAFSMGGSNMAKNEKTKAAITADLKYIYSAFTKIPCLRLCPDPKARLIGGYEEFPFDTAVPLLAFKNLTALEINDIDVRQFFGWDQLAERLRSLVIKRGGIEDPAELTIAIVLDDMDKRRQRSSKNQTSPINWSAGSAASDTSAPNSPQYPVGESLTESVISVSSNHKGSVSPPRSSSRGRDLDTSPTRPDSSRNNSSHHHRARRMRRSDSGSSRNSLSSSQVLQSSASFQGLNLMGQLPSLKWRFLRHLSLADNALTSISAASLTPLANSLTSFDLSSNLFVSVPDALANLPNLRALNLSNNMIDSLHSLTRSPLPSITALNLRGNRLSSLAGIECLTTLERLDIRENRLRDPTELARITSALKVGEIWVSGNAFVKTHSASYRLTIFNLFRKTPGYTEDIAIDSQGPGMMERRSLMERAVLAPSPPPVVASSPMLPPKEIIRRSSELSQRPSPVRHSIEKPIDLVSTIPEEVARGKKKITRRRVVELSRGEGGAEVFTSPEIAPKFSPADFELHAGSPPARSLSYQQRQQLPATPPQSGRTKLAPIIGGEAPPTPPPKDAPNLTRLNSNETWGQQSDDYKRRVEALKNEVGSGWLSVLGDDNWDKTQRARTPASPL